MRDGGSTVGSAAARKAVDLWGNFSENATLSGPYCYRGRFGQNTALVVQRAELHLARLRLDLQKYT